MTYKYLIIILVLLFSTFDSYAQCSVELSKEADGTIIRQAKLENLYENVGSNNDGDYSIGFIQVRGRLFTRSSPQSLSKTWGLQIVVGGKPSTEVIVPRRLYITFLNGIILTLNAIDYQEIDGGIQVCQFNLTDVERASLKNPIKTLVILDNRKEHAYASTKKYGLYDRVLSEQISCLE
jgi:hypothetical protein